LISWEVRHGDCLSLSWTAPADLVYMDPPYSFVGEDSYYGVGSSFDEFLEWVLARITHVLAGRSDFNFVLHLDDKASHYLKVEVDRLLGRGNFRNEIVWAWSGPSVAASRLPRKHNVLLWWGVGDYAYNPVRVPHKSLSLGGSKSWLGDIPPEEVEAVREEILAKGKLLEDWWVDIPPLIRGGREKTGWPTQKPVALMERVVGMFSRPGSLVIDPMMGSGTTGVAALLSGRGFSGADLSKEALNLARPRLTEAEPPFFLMG